jgi:hypothetical protein
LPAFLVPLELSFSTLYLVDDIHPLLWMIILMDEDNPLPHRDVAFGPIVGVASHWLQFKVGVQLQNILYKRSKKISSFFIGDHIGHSQSMSGENRYLT